MSKDYKGIVDKAIEHVLLDVDATIKYVTENAPIKIQKLEKTASVLLLLAKAHPDKNIRQEAEDNFTNFGLTYGVNFDLGMNEPGKLTTLRKIIGKLSYSGTEVADPDRRRRLVKVTMKSVEAPGVTFTYLHRLPKTKEIKCKLVTTVRKETRLVCE